MLRTDSEHPISASNTAVCQARTEETIPIKRRSTRQPARAQHPSVPRVVRHASWLLKPQGVKPDGYTPHPTTKGRPYGGEVVELVEQVYWEVPGLTQHTFGDRSASWNMARQSGEVGRTPHRSSRQGARCQIHSTSAYAAPLQLTEGQRIELVPHGK